MLRIVVGGQINKVEVAKLIEEIGKDQVEVIIKSDIEAALAVKTNQADYYLGACRTGGGGALAMAIALLGYSLCSTVSMPGKIKSNEEIVREVRNGKKAFGFTPEHAEIVIPVIINELLKI